jgi:hypothetical protein
MLSYPNNIRYVLISSHLILGFPGTLLPSHFWLKLSTVFNSHSSHGCTSLTHLASPFWLTHYLILECYWPCHIYFVAGFRQIQCVSLLYTNSGCIELMCLSVHKSRNFVLGKLKPENEKVPQVKWNDDKKNSQMVTHKILKYFTDLCISWYQVMTFDIFTL